MAWLPAEPSPGSDFQRVGPSRLPGWRRVGFALLQAGKVVAVILPLVVLVLEGLISTRLGNGVEVPTPASALFYLDALAISSVLFFGAMGIGLLAAMTLPRLLRLLVRPGRTYPLYSLRYSVLRTVSFSSNRPGFNALFGDSSAATRYLRWLGWDLGRLSQTGSNFGTAQKQETPFLSRVGRGTMISDGLTMANAEYSATSFRVLPTTIGARNFVGNNVVYPAGGRTGDNVLLATKVMVPLDGEVHHDTGLLGSPAFPIPRSVQRDAQIVQPGPGLETVRALRAKNRHNAATMALLLWVRWVQLFLVTALGLAAIMIYDEWGALAVAVWVIAALLVSVAWLMLAERAVMGFRRLRPRSCSIYDPYFWRHERLWKLWKLLAPALAVFNGTPFKPLMLRALGVRVGRRLYDGGATIPEHTLVSLGDDCTLNTGATIQCHSLEDGGFTSDRTSLGDGVTVGVAAFVHYGVTLHEGAVLDADAFLMKGSDVPPRSRWRGNPAADTT